MLKENKSKDAIVLVGAGGHAKVVISVLRKRSQDIKFILDDNPHLCKAKFKGYLIKGSTEELRTCSRAFLAIGDNKARYDLAEKYPHISYPYFVHPTATVDQSVSIGSGTIIMAGAIVQADAQIGNQTIINSGAVVEHGCQIHAFSHIGPRSTLAGSVTVGEGAFLGASSVVNDQKKVGSWATVGSGACVVNNIPPHCIVVGVPAEPLK